MWRATNDVIEAMNDTIEKSYELVGVMGGETGWFSRKEKQEGWTGNMLNDLSYQRIGV